MHPRTRKGLLTEIGKEAHRIRLDFDASDDTAHSPACPRVPSCPGILEAAKFSDRSAWISMHPRTRPRLPACYSCPLLPRNFRGGKILRPLRLDFDASTDTASFASLLLVSPLAQEFQRRQKSQTAPLGFRCIHGHSSFASLSSGPRPTGIFSRSRDDTPSGPHPLGFRCIRGPEGAFVQKWDGNP